ncbi:hypothetical protein HDU67_007966 [Dinochytrium kinnereticum]|nr:hypothetical protein HDU67_007966 [Dinochytrium kinnereticum]
MPNTTPDSSTAARRSTRSPPKTLMGGAAPPLPPFPPPVSRVTNGSDIMMGDFNVFGGTTQFSSTMKVDYGRHSVQSQERETQRTPAGKALGISNSNEIHVVFGDGRKQQMDRFQSVTTESYQSPVENCLSDPPRRFVGKRVDGRLENWEGRTELIMAAAHVGVKTREDLPIDDKRFRSFVTTNQDAYHFHTNAVGGVRAAQACPRVGTSIPQGDREKQQCYESVASSSFVRHPPRSYGITQKAEAPPAGAVMEGDPRYLSNFTTTSKASYPHPAAPTTRDESDGIVKERGRSSIAFGESIQTDETKKPTGLTITQQDYTSLPLQTYIDARKKAKDSKPSIYIGDGTNLGSIGALRPNKDVSKSLREADETHREATRLIATHPSTAPHPSLQTNMYRSSIMTGDPTKYKFSSSTTTTSESFKAYPSAPFPTFPIAGANITRSNFEFGDEGGVGRSTSGDAFVDYGGKVERVERVKRGEMSFMGALNGEYPMGDNITSNAQFYRDPGVDGRVMGVAPKLWLWSS